ncbi:MAG: diguanylate cyclase [Pseudomonadales bacterium]
MTSITKLKTAQSIQHFEPAVAFNLVLAFHRQLDLDALLGMFHSQVTALLQATGSHYRNSQAGIDRLIGTSGRHTASYNLTYQETHLGELILNFNRRVNEEVLNTAEDLIALVMPAIRNALTYRAALQGAPAPELHERSTQRAETRPERGDSLVLVQIDGMAEIRERDGDDRAQTLLTSVRDQLIAGLRDGDSVFQIDDATLAVLLPGTASTQAIDVARKLRVLIASLHLKDGKVPQQLTACMGIAGADRASSAEAVLDQAREALKLARKSGPNSLRSAVAEAG